MCPGYNPGGSISLTSVPDKFEYLFPVVNASALQNPPSVASNAYGSGRIVATANYVGAGCFMNYPYSLPSLKFAYNVLAMSSTWTNVRKDIRHSGGSIDTVGGTKLAKIWKFNKAPSATESAAVIYKNVVFYSSGSALYALDLKPQEDLDNDGKTDEGVEDLSLGGDQDVIWEFDPGDGELSPPTVVTMQNPRYYNNPGNSVDAVIVASKSGNIYVLDAFPASSSGKLLSETTSLLYPSTPCWKTSGSFSNSPYPPIFINGWIYTVAEAGTGAGCHIYAMNPILRAFHNGSDPDEWSWEFPQSTSTIFSGDTLKSGLCFGYACPQDGGALIGMLYFATSAKTSTTGGTTSSNDMVAALPIHVRNDRLKLRKVVGDYAECQSSLSPAKIGTISRVWFKNYDESSLQIVGDPVANESITGGTKYGAIKIQASGTAASKEGEIPGDVIVSADYDLAYNFSGNIIPNVKQISMTLDPNVVSSSSGTVTFPTTLLAATPALGSDSMLFLSGTRDVSTSSTSSTLRPGGSVYGYQLDGTNKINRWNYLMHAGIEAADLDGVSDNSLTAIPNSKSSTMVLPGVVMKKLSDNYWEPLQDLQPYASPAYSNDKVFVTVSGDNGGALLCFKANPDFVIRIMENIGYDADGKPIKKAKSLYDTANNRKQSVSIWQPNLLDSTAPGLLNNGAVPVPSSMIDYNRGTITFSDFNSLHMRGLAGTFSPSLPVWVLLDAAEVPIDFSTWGPLTHYRTTTQRSSLSVDLSGWNNLLWYYPIDNQVHSSPVVIGDTVYFQDDSGTIYALKAESDETQGGPLDDDQVIWKKSDGTGGNDKNFSIAGSNGVLIIPRADGLYAYSNTTTLVADSSRIVELDGAGELSWATDSITWPTRIPQSTNGQPASTTGPVNKPNRVRYVNQGEMLLVNSGANQVCRIDKSAQVGSMLVATTGTSATNYTKVNTAYIRWMYDKFSDPNRLLRPGQPTTLSGPTDALLWEEVESDSGGQAYQMVHCLIADSGNHRVVDLVYKFKVQNNNRTLVANDSDIDPDSGYCLPRLNWVSITDSTNQNYVYDSIQLVPNESTDGYDIWAAISNFRTGTGTSVSNDGLGGAIVALRYRVVKSGDKGNYWNYAADDSGRIAYGCDRMNFSAMGGPNLAPLATPRYFQVVDSDGVRNLYVCDNYGVYKATIPDTSGIPSVVQMLNGTDYRGLDRNDSNSTQDLQVPLRAVCVSVLPNGNWLITNNFAGTDSSGTVKFNGEVFEYNPTPASGALNIEWCSPNIDFTPDDPKGDPYTWEQTISNGQILNEPTCAYRLF